MRWDIFSGSKRERGGSVRDEINEHITRIERFAPRKHGSERRVHYYNYQIMDAYQRPLSRLLDLIAQEKRMAEDEEAFVSQIFMRLKDFYDVRQRLSLSEAIQDKNLQRRFARLLLIFYGKKDRGTLRASLRRLEHKG